MKIFFLKALFLSFLLVISDACFVMAADKKSPAKNSNAFTKTEQKAVHDLNKAFKVMRNMNHSSAQSCKLDDNTIDPKTIKLILCDKPMAVAPGCVSPLYRGSSYDDDGEKEDFSKNLELDPEVSVSNIVQTSCNVCGQEMSVYGRVQSFMSLSSVDKGKYNTYPRILSNLYTKTNLEVIRSLCLKKLQEYPNSILASQPSNIFFSINTVNEEVQLADDFNIIVGAIQGSVSWKPGVSGEVEGYPVSSQKVCEGQEQEKAEVAKYATEDAPTKQPVQGESDTNELLYIPGSITNNGKTLGVSDLPTLKGVFDYQLHGDEENKEDMEYRLNMFVDPGVILRKSVGQHAVDQRKLRLTAEDEQSYVHHLVFDKKAASIEEILPVLNREANKMRGIIKPRCEADQVEHLNVTTSQADGTSVTQRYILKCEMKNGKRVLSVSDLKK